MTLQDLHEGDDAAKYCQWTDVMEGGAVYRLICGEDACREWCPMSSRPCIASSLNTMYVVRHVHHSSGSPQRLEVFRKVRSANSATRHWATAWHKRRTRKATWRCCS